MELLDTGQRIAAAGRMHDRFAALGGRTDTFEIRGQSDALLDAELGQLAVLRAHQGAHAMALFKQGGGDGPTEKTGRAGQQYLHTLSNRSSSRRVAASPVPSVQHCRANFEG